MACFPELELNPPGEGDGLGQNGSGGDEGGEGGETIELELSAAEPFHGSNLGGLVTYIEGGPFDWSVEVWFADQQATVVNVAESSIEVEVPAYDSTGPVTITATTDDGAGEVALGFRYWEDQSEQTVITGGLFQWEWVGPDLRDSDGEVIFQDRTAHGLLYATEPGDWTFLDAMSPGIGHCGQASAPSMVAVPNEATVESSGVSLPFGPESDSEYLSYYEEDQRLDLARRTFSVDIPSGGEYPDQYIQDSIVLSAGVELVAPIIDELTVWSDLYGINIATSPILWEGATGDYVYLKFYDTWGSGLDFGCVVENTGSFTLTNEDFAGFTSDDYSQFVDLEYLTGPLYQALVRVIDLNLTKTQLDFNNGQATLVGGNGVLGWAYFWDGT
jgi:hypothetical protein